VTTQEHRRRIAKGIYPEPMVPVVEELLAEAERLREALENAEIYESGLELAREVVRLQERCSELTLLAFERGEERDRLADVEKAARKLVDLHGTALGLPVLPEGSLDAAVEAWADLREALPAREDGQ
jgi:hypothetical protein